MYDTLSHRASSVGSKVSFSISPQSLAFSTRHRKHRKFNLNAKPQRKRYLCLLFTVLPPQQSLSFGQNSLGLSPRLWALLRRSRWPFYCLWLAAWYITFVPNEDGSPFCSCPSFRVLCPIFPPAVVFLLSCDLTLPPKEISAFSSDLLFCLNWF